MHHRVPHNPLSTTPYITQSHNHTSLIPDHALDYARTRPNTQRARDTAIALRMTRGPLCVNSIYSGRTQHTCRLSRHRRFDVAVVVSAPAHRAGANSTTRSRASATKTSTRTTRVRDGRCGGDRYGRVDTGLGVGATHLVLRWCSCATTTTTD